MGCTSSKAPPEPPKVTENTLLLPPIRELTEKSESDEQPPKTLAEYAGCLNKLALADLNATIAGLNAENKKKLEDAINGLGAKAEVIVDPVKDEPAKNDSVQSAERVKKVEVSMEEPETEYTFEAGDVDGYVGKNEFVVESQSANNSCVFLCK